MTTLAYALGLVLIVEGLVFALAPSFLESLLEAVRSVSVDQRRLIGLAAFACGVGLVALTRA